MSTTRTISAEDLRSPGYLRAPDETKPTAIGLWMHTDIEGRRPLIPELIAGDVYPGRAAAELVEEHLLLLAECGFLRIYRHGADEFIQLARPLRGDRRGAASDCPPPPQGVPGNSAAVGGARERARARVLSENVASASRWAEWAGEQEQAPRPPQRPLLLDAPPIGCPDHPSGRFADCGPCGTARRRHDKWVAEARYGEQLIKHEEGQEGHDEPF